MTNGFGRVMPAFGNQLTEEERWHILNFLQSEFGTLGSSDISAQGFLEEDIGLAIIEIVNRGAIEDAESTFYAEGLHNFVHNVDGPVREKNKELGKEMCAALIELEEDMAAHASTFDISLDGQRLRDLLRQAAQVLGFPPPPE